MRMQTFARMATACAIVVSGSTGCGDHGAQPSSSGTSGPANGVYAVVVTANTPGGLPRCTSSLAGSVAHVSSPSSLWSCTAGLWIPIECDGDDTGKVAYQASTQTLWACASGTWTQVVLPQGPQGLQGDAGPQGPQGEAGAESLVSATPVGPQTQCPNGGNEIQSGVDTNGDGVLESSEVRQTTFVCNGASTPPTGDGPCTADADCDDAKACTTDSCLSGTCAHSFAPSQTVCRPAAGPCDATEFCSGSSTECPADAYEPATVVCEGSGGPCKPASNCTGQSTACPSAVVEPQGFVCLAATECGVASTCDGVTGACPAQAPVAAGTTCSAAACHSNGTCDGTSLTCPTGSALTDGTSCGSGEICVSGNCDLGCLIGGTFYYDGEQNGACAACVPSTSTTSWTALTGQSCGTVCDGGDYVAQAICGGSDGMTCVVNGGGQFEYCESYPNISCTTDAEGAYCPCNSSADCSAGYTCGFNGHCQ